MIVILKREEYRFYVGIAEAMLVKLYWENSHENNHDLLFWWDKGNPQIFGVQIEIRTYYLIAL